MDSARAWHDGLRCPLCHGALAGERICACDGCATPFHLGCWRELGGCSTLGCSEVGRAGASTTGPVVEKGTLGPPSPRPVAGAPAWLLVSWFVGAFSGLLALGVVLFGVVSLGRAGRARGALLALAFSPVALPVVAVVDAALGYRTGSAELVSRDHPDPTWLDPVIRCPARRPAYIRTGYEELSDLANNVTLRALGDLFGPMAGAYEGPLPRVDGATAALEASDEHVDRERLAEHGRVVVAGRELTLPLEVARQLAGCRWGEGRLHDAPLPRRAELRVALVDDRTLAVADEHDPALGSLRGRCVWRIDVETGRVVVRRSER